MRTRIMRMVMAGLLAAVFLAQPGTALACATCYGKSDSPLALGMNWGIFVLLGFVSMVLMGIAGMGFYFVRRGNAVAAGEMKSSEKVEGLNE